MVTASSTELVTASAPVSVQPPVLQEFKGKRFKFVHLEGVRDPEPVIHEYPAGK